MSADMSIRSVELEPPKFVRSIIVWPLGDPTGVPASFLGSVSVRSIVVLFARGISHSHLWRL